MQLPVYKKDGTKTSEMVEIPDAMLSVEPNDHVIWLAVRSELAARRQGTHDTKIRKYVRGGGRKPFKQKGRGMARQGTIRSPLMPGGGTIFGPTPHKYSVKISDKVKRVARLSAFVAKAKSDKIRVVEDFTLSAPRTREIAGVLKALGLAEEKVLLLSTDADAMIAKSIRNMPHAASQRAESASTRELVDCTTILMQKGAVAKLVKGLIDAA